MSPSRLNGSTPDQIEADIARQREQLADTIDELHARLDVKSRAGHKLAEIRDRATDDRGRPTPRVAAAAAAAALLAVGAVLWRRHSA